MCLSPSVRLVSGTIGSNSKSYFFFESVDSFQKRLSTWRIGPQWAPTIVVISRVKWGPSKWAKINGYLEDHPMTWIRG